VSSRGVFKDPLLLHLRLVYHDVTNNLSEVLASYYLEHLVGYKTILTHPELLSEMQLEAFDLNCRYFTKHHSFIPGFLLGTFNAALTPLINLFAPGRRPLFLRLRSAFRHSDPTFTDLLGSLPGVWDQPNIHLVLQLFNLYVGQRSADHPPITYELLEPLSCPAGNHQ
jgi:hypothetical protein